MLALQRLKVVKCAYPCEELGCSKCKQNKSGIWPLNSGCEGSAQTESSDNKNMQYILAVFLICCFDLILEKSGNRAMVESSTIIYSAQTIYVMRKKLLALGLCIYFGDIIPG